MRRLMKIVESMEEPKEDDPDNYGEDYDEDDEDTRFDNLPASSALKPLRASLALAAQRVYDSWDQSDPDNDELNGGGICHLIADQLADIINDAGIPCTSQSSCNEQHVYCVAQCSDGIFEVDVPHRLYERGGGFTWTKLPGITFSEGDISIYQLDFDPGKMAQYVDGWEEE